MIRVAVARSGALIVLADRTDPNCEKTSSRASSVDKGTHQLEPDVLNIIQVFADRIPCATTLRLLGQNTLVYDNPRLKRKAVSY